ncbi:MAG: YraN family protein [Bacteroidales bacterium]|nr:YraN family protein [Bacteroidales bacterium]
MAESHDLGREGENRAVRYLEEAGYRILRRNWRSGRIEIDLIAENKEYVVFVEVKTRSENFVEAPGSAVNKEKQRSIIYAADNYVKWNYIDKESRFDIITVIKKGGMYEIEHTENAFYPTLR